MVSASSSSSTASTTPRPAPTALQSSLNASDVGVWSSAATVVCVDPVVVVSVSVCLQVVGIAKMFLLLQ